MCSDNVIKVTAGLIASLTFVAELNNLRKHSRRFPIGIWLLKSLFAILEDDKRKDLRIRIKYPDQNVHFVVPRMRDLKRITNDSESEGNNWLYFIRNEVHSNDFTVVESNWKLRTTLLLSHGVWTEASQIDVSLCLAVRSGHELELCKPIKILFAPKPVKRGI